MPKAVRPANELLARVAATGGRPDHRGHGCSPATGPQGGRPWRVLWATTGRDRVKTAAARKACADKSYGLIVTALLSVAGGRTKGVPARFRPPETP